MGTDVNTKKFREPRSGLATKVGPPSYTQTDRQKSMAAFPVDLKAEYFNPEGSVKEHLMINPSIYGGLYV